MITSPTTTTTISNTMTSSVVDCVIIGGSYAGLSAALALGRSLRNTIVIDNGLPCNRFASHSHNFLSHDGSNPSDIAQLGRQQIQEQYKTVQFIQGRVESAKIKKDDNDNESESIFELVTDSGDNIFESKKIIFASGITDLFPTEISGFAECWGKSVIHCPYCHGFEFQTEPTGLFMNPTFAMHMAPIVRNLTPNLTIFCTDLTGFTDDQLDRMKANQIEVISTNIREIQHDDGFMTGVVLDDGRSIPLKALYAALPFELNCKSLMETLGCTVTEQGYLAVNDMQKTNVPGIFGCGDSTTMFRSVANAVRGGHVAGAVVNMELCSAEFAKGRSH